MRIFGAILRWFTNAVFQFFLIGIILLIVGQGDFLHSLFPDLLSPNSWESQVIKTVGVALIGSGVFTAIIKSSEYSQVFSNIIGEIIWSKKFIEKRSDKKEMWSMVSRTIYDEKFPLISADLEDIITSEYFPTAQSYYMENYEVVINVSNENEHFYLHNETVKTTLRPNDRKICIPYSLRTAIDLPDNAAVEDITDCVTDEFYINGVIQTIKAPQIDRTEKYLIHELKVDLQNDDAYHFMLKRHKFLCKKTNPDKCFRAKSIIKNLKVTIIRDVGLNIDFYRMGTVNEFITENDQVNQGVKISSWSYQGLILPHQGFILVFK